MLLDPNLITYIFNRNSGIQLKPMYMPRGYKISDFTIFYGEDDNSTLEHIERFITQYGEGNHNKF